MAIIPKISLRTYIERIESQEWCVECMADAETGFCMRCKESVVIADPVRLTMANGRNRVSGVCSKLGCEGRISKIVG